VKELEVWYQPLARRALPQKSLHSSLHCPQTYQSPPLGSHRLLLQASIHEGRGGKTEVRRHGLLEGWTGLEMLSSRLGVASSQRPATLSSEMLGKTVTGLALLSGCSARASSSSSCLNPSLCSTTVLLVLLSRLFPPALSTTEARAPLGSLTR